MKNWGLKSEILTRSITKTSDDYDAKYVKTKCNLDGKLPLIGMHL